MIKRSAEKNSLKPALLPVASDGSTDLPETSYGIVSENTPITEEGCYTAVMRRTSISRRIIRSTQRAVHLTGALLLLAGWSVHGATPKAVFILVDGIPADLVESVSTPFLMKSRKAVATRALMSEGRQEARAKALPCRQWVTTVFSPGRGQINTGSTAIRSVAPTTVTGTFSVW